MINLSNNYISCCVQRFHINYKTHSTYRNYSINSIRHFADGPTITLDPTQYKRWTKEEVCSLLQAEKKLGGAGLEDVKIKPLYDAGFSGCSIDNILVNIGQNGEKDAIIQLAAKFERAGFVPSFELMETLESVVRWVKELLETKLIHRLTPNQLKEVICGPVLNESEFEPFQNMSGSEFHSQVIDYILNANYSELSIGNKVIDIPPNLKLWTENTLQRVKEYELRRTSSIEDFNIQMRKLGLANENSHIYIYPTKLDTEKSLSCEFIGCSYAPTFPEGKYKEREEFLQPNKVLTFIEPPGTGKTHFAYHLTNSNRLVAPLNTKHVTNLFTKLNTIPRSNDLKDYRLQLDIITEQFTEFYNRVILLLFNYSEMFLSDKISSVTMKQYILRFLWNRGGNWIGLQDFKYRSIFMKDSNPIPIVWILDEVQMLCYTPFSLSIPFRTSLNNSGNLLTLIAASLRSRGSLVLTTTYYSCIEDKIETLISKDSGKSEMEKLSHQFKLLPLLNPKQVMSFLKYFITPNDNNQLWEYVSFILQGNIRNTESFLQILYLNTSSKIDSIDVTQLVNESLYEVFYEKMKGLSYRETKLKLETIPFYEYIFYKLAITGEVTLDNYQSRADEITTFLIQIGVSFTFEHSNTFKLISCIEKARMLNYIFDQVNWFDKCYNILNSPYHNPSKKDNSLLSQLFTISLLRNHYNSLFLPLLKGSCAENYIIEGKYFFEDSETSNEAKGDIKFSSLMIQSLVNNVSPIHCVISQFFSLPRNGGMDILGMLKKTQDSDVIHPNFIPLSVAISRDVTTDFKTLNGKRVRVMFHPNQNYSNSLKERIELGLHGNSQKVKRELTRYSVIMEDNSCLVEISSRIENEFNLWKPFMSDWNKYF